MKKKWRMLGGICIILVLIFANIPQKPRIISSITTFDTAYLTILVDKFETRNIEKLKAKILQMCREDDFESIKLQTEDKPRAKKFYISVYNNKKDLERGIPFLTIKNDAGN